MTITRIKPPHIIAVLPVGHVSSRMHVSTLERYTIKQLKRGLPAKEYPVNMEQQFYAPLLKIFRNHRDDEFTLEDLYLKLRGTKKPHAFFRAAIMCALAHLGRKGLVQYMTINIEIPAVGVFGGKLRKNVAVGAAPRDLQFWGMTWAPMTAFRYVRQKRGGGNKAKIAAGKLEKERYPLRAAGRRLKEESKVKRKLDKSAIDLTYIGLLHK